MERGRGGDEKERQGGRKKVERGKAERRVITRMRDKRGGRGGDI